MAHVMYVNMRFFFKLRVAVYFSSGSIGVWGNMLSKETPQMYNLGSSCDVEAILAY